MAHAAPPLTHVVCFHGISLWRRNGWSFRLRDSLCMPASRWIELNYDDLLSRGAERTRGTLLQRLFWRLVGDASGYARVREEIVQRCILALTAIPDGSPLIVACHSWGTVIAHDVLTRLHEMAGPEFYPLRRVIYMGAALGNDPPETLPTATHGLFNLRARLLDGIICDPISLSLSACEPAPREEWVRALHSTLWSCRRLRELIREVMA